MAKSRSSNLSQSTAGMIQRRFYQAWALTEIVSKPTHWIYLMNSRSKLLNKTVLGVASGAFDPKLLLTVLRVEEWTPSRVGLVFDRVRLGPLQKHSVSLSDLTSAADLALRVYWNRYLISDLLNFQVTGMRWDGKSSLKRPVKVRYGHPEIERDQLLFELGSSGKKTLDTSVIVLDQSDIRLGTFEFTLEFTGPLSIGATSIGATAPL